MGGLKTSDGRGSLFFSANGTEASDLILNWRWRQEQEQQKQQQEQQQKQEQQEEQQQQHQYAAASHGVCTSSWTQPLHSSSVETEYRLCGVQTTRSDPQLLGAAAAALVQHFF